MWLRPRRNSLFCSNFFEYFYYFVLIILMVIILLGGPLYFYFFRTMKEQSLKINRNTLEQLKNSQQIVFEEVNRSFSIILLDSVFQDYAVNYGWRRKRLSITGWLWDMVRSFTMKEWYGRVVDSYHIHITWNRKYCGD